MNYREYFKNVFYNLIKGKRKIIFALIAGFGVTATYAYADVMQKDIASKVVRLHVKANSNAEKDAALKMKARDAVIAATEDLMKESASRKESVEALERNKELIKAAALNAVRTGGAEYDVNVYLSEELFPPKKYGIFTFPTGRYVALRVELGKAEGDNWWCVMFPPMCFLESDYGETPQEAKDRLKETLSDEEYDILAQGNGENIDAEIKFKIIELWQSFRAKGKEFATNEDF